MSTLEEWRGIFDRFDENKDGLISLTELAALFNALGRFQPHAVFTL
jgi:Ca2+-binding EF-hand superfamily protein